MHWPVDRPILLSVRRLAKRMGLDLLIEAISEVRQEFPDVLLLIGGKGPQREELQRMISDSGLEHNVRLLGFVAEADLPLAYAAADFSIVPTLALEGFGLITAESLASGTPVLGTPVGATPEILTPLEPKLVFESASVFAMTDRIRSVLRKDFALPCRESCRVYVQHYGWPVVAPQLMSVYAEIRNEITLDKPYRERARM
jgi:glycosyltransferase involved in cell wall biosynthesis